MLHALQYPASQARVLLDQRGRLAATHRIRVVAGAWSTYVVRRKKSHAGLCAQARQESNPSCTVAMVSDLDTFFARYAERYMAYTNHD
ncbi:MAG TPA: hypothetical protein VKO84_00265 [Gaiellaceae bacterium]|nr:hypothetical protein [Gaiellaceae bacterium]